MTKFTKISSVFAAITLLIVLGFSKSPETIDEPVLTEKSSISIKNGKYFVDTVVIRQNRNKKNVLEVLNRSYLAEKKNLSEIPPFIKAFLDSVSCERKFEIANSDEEWTSCITAFAPQHFKKIYDEDKKDSVVTLTWDNKHLPDKQMVYFGIGKSVALLSYFSGKFQQNQQIVVIKFEAEKVVDFWFGAYYSGSPTARAELIKQIKLAGTRSSEGC